MVELANRALSYHNDSLSFACVGSVDLIVKTSLFQYEAENVHFNETIHLKKEDIEPQIRIENLSLAENGDSIDMISKISIFNKLPMNFALASINWDVLLDGCDRPYQVGSWTSENITVKPNSPIPVQLAGNVGRIPKELLEPCDNGYSSINTIVNRYVSSKPITVHLRASEDNEKLPPWFLYIAHNVNFKFQFEPRFPQINLPRITFGDLSIEIPQYSLNFKDRDAFAAFLNANVSVQVDAPSGFDVTGDVLQLKSAFQLKIGNSTLTSGSSRNYLDWDFANHTIAVDVDTRDDSIQVLDPHSIAQLISDYTNSGLNADLTVNATFNDVHVNLPILSTVLDNVAVEVPFELDSAISWPSFENLNFTVNNMFVVGAVEDAIELKIDFQISNPTLVTVDIPKETVGGKFVFDDVVIGEVRMTDIFVPKHESDVNCTANFLFSVPSTDSRVSLEMFASEFMSGVQNLTLGIRGQAQESGNRGLQKLIGGIEIDDFPLPAVHFGGSSGSPNPFLVESVLHLLTSEIEVTVFNPLNNTEALVTILDAEASYEGTVLGHIDHRETLMVPPGIYKTPRIKLKISLGVGMDILRKAIDGTLRVNVTAAFDTTVQQFGVQLLYHGQGLAAKIRL